MKKKRSVALLVAWIIGAAYAIYLVSYFGGLMGSAADTAEQLGSGIATALVTPHMVCVIIAVIFNIIGWAGNTRWAALVGGIMYSVAAVMFIMYALFVVPSIVLSFVGYAKLKKLNAPAIAPPTQTIE